MSPRQQARRAGPTVIFPTGHDDRPRLWPALSLAAAVCVALVILSVRWSSGGLPARTARAPAAMRNPAPPPAMVFPEDHPAAAAPQRQARSATRPVRQADEEAEVDAEPAAIETRDAASQPSAPQPAAAARPSVAPAPAPAASPPSTPAVSAPVAQDPPPLASLPPARLFVSSQPWGRLYVDGQFVGNTPRLNLPVSPGRRRIRVSRDGYASFDTTIAAMPETVMRLTGISLREVSP